MVPTTVKKTVPVTTTHMESYTVCKQVPYTVCKQVPYTVTVKVPYTVTECVPTCVTKKVKTCVAEDVCVQKARMVPVTVAPCQTCQSAPVASDCGCGDSKCGSAVACGCESGHRSLWSRLCHKRLACDTGCGSDCGCGK